VDRYELTVEVRPDYLHASVTGDRTADNVDRFLREAYAACVDNAKSNLLLEMRLTGSRLGTFGIYRLISDRSADGARLRRIAYVEDPLDNVEEARFAETVAVNRAVNVRLFMDVSEAARWLESDLHT
jgi:SpoIIAA-like